MGTTVQSKTYFPSSTSDLNKGFCNGTWDLYHDDRNSGSRNSQCYESFPMRQTVEGYTGLAKEQIRQTILKQETVFRHQLQELHRLYKRQKDLMKELARKEQCNYPMPAETNFGRLSGSGTDSIWSPLNSLTGKNMSKDFDVRLSNPKCGFSEKRSIDLELPANMNENDESKQQVQNVKDLTVERSYNLADLNEPIQVEETEKKQMCDSFANSNSVFCFLSKFSQQDLAEREGRIHSGDSHIRRDRQKNEQLSRNFSDGKTKLFDHAYQNGTYSHCANSPIKAIGSSFPLCDQNNTETKRNRKIFGVELCERSHTPSSDSSHILSSQASNPQSNVINSESSVLFPWRKTSSTVNRDHLLAFSNASRQTPEYFSGDKFVNNSNSRLMTSSVSDNLGEPCCFEKLELTHEQKNHESSEKRLPPWLMANPRLCHEQTKEKETTLYQMNLDSLQNHSQQFFKKADKCESNNVKIDNFQSVMKILGVPIIDLPKKSESSVSEDNTHDPKVENQCEVEDLVKDNGQNNRVSDMRCHFDLNLSFEEEEAPPSAPSFPEAIVENASTEVDLEAAPVLVSETVSLEISTPSKLRSNEDPMDTHLESLKIAAEAIMSISSSNTAHEIHPPEEAPADTLLRWFADVIASHDKVNIDLVKSCDEDSVPEGMDYFEYTTLKLRDTKDKCYYYDNPMVFDEEKENKPTPLTRRTTRKGQGKRGRQRKDFQRDILPSLISLSRREVTEDLQTFEEVFTTIGVSWKSSLSKRKAAAKNGRGRRRLVVPDPSPPPPPPQLPPTATEQSICREVALEEKTLGGWGKRTRRLPRQRCANGGNHHHSLAMKC